jgi:hypothetical protein
MEKISGLQKNEISQFLLMGSFQNQFYSASVRISKPLSQLETRPVSE